VVTDFEFWWLFVVAAMLSYFLNQVFAPEKKPELPPSQDPDGPPPAIGR
jgi:hypothetical protein